MRSLQAQKHCKHQTKRAGIESKAYIDDTNKPDQFTHRGCGVFRVSAPQRAASPRPPNQKKHIPVPSSWHQMCVLPHSCPNYRFVETTHARSCSVVVCGGDLAIILLVYSRMHFKKIYIYM